MSYPKMSPLDAATMQVITTENVILPSKPVPEASTANPPTAILVVIFSYSRVPMRAETDYPLI